MSRGSHAECCENGSRVSRSWGLKWRLDSERERERGGKRGGGRVRKGRRAPKTAETKKKCPPPRERTL